MVTRLPAGVRALCAVADDGHQAILVNRDLPPAERLAALAHELVHLERGGGCHRPGLHDRLRPLRAREEAQVDRIVARRLVPLDLLEAWAAARAEVGPVTTRDVADEFEVPLAVALEAMRQVA
ncbi:hypothetical protein PO878_08060 [Iamia majanohamensis]|uniref:IrrE N-terminal-like domain-containing protein n=1 Tax=Iamia majanohamensis TaxID=467976 RepID=A0AAE9YIN0_9ACTN|nr:ImmA/IrrE family metallo-endopeptidase [Iamia majanohamensis]WCO68681.1 hypothetical protein PO878_08060 [Iamia majanohamensis]